MATESQFDSEFLHEYKHEFKDVFAQALAIYKQELEKGESQEAAFKMSEDFLLKHPFVNPLENLM